MDLDDLADAFDRDRSDRHRRGTHRWARLLATLIGLATVLAAVVIIAVAVSGDDDDDGPDDDSWGPAGAVVLVVLEDAA